MRKSLFIFLFGIISIYAFGQLPVIVQGVRIQWTVRYEQPIGGGIPTPKSPVQGPVVSIDGHTLYLYDVTDDVTLQIFDENENEVCTLYVPAGTTSVALPTTLEGEYQIQLHNGGIYYFLGFITL